MSMTIEPGEVEAFLSGHEPVREARLCRDGDFVGPWHVTAFLGRGAAGEVFRTDRPQVAALKVLARDDEAARGRFRREAMILELHPHPVLPRFYGFGEAAGRPYMAIELLEPLPLPHTDRTVSAYLRKLCEGVALLHRLGLVHRDIKPANILCRPGSKDPVLIDLGLVQVDPSYHPAGYSVVDGRLRGVGTPGYSAPEQFLGGQVSPAADIHALGMLVNECFGGRLPRCWQRIVRRATSSIPGQRYATVAEFARAVHCRHHLRIFSLLVVFTVVTLAAVSLALILK